jgi:uncharacterized protein (DUF488 family)
MLDLYINSIKDVGKLGKLFTIGYQSLLIDKFIFILKKNKIERIVDVRRYAQSEVNDYTGFILMKILKDNNIDYIWTPQISPLGDLLNKYKFNKDWEKFRMGYILFLDKNKKLFNDWVLLLKDNDCLLCYEKYFMRCHRSLLVEKINELFCIINL